MLDVSYFLHEIREMDYLKVPHDFCPAKVGLQQALHPNLFMSFRFVASRE